MNHIFIAVGGSGTKVAEALVRLLALGFPTRFDRQKGVYTSAGDTLQIWLLDPDRNAGASVALQACLKKYNDIQTQLGAGWAMNIAPALHLDPLQLPGNRSLKTLKGVLDAGYTKTGSRALPSASLLAPFYEEKDLEVEIDRGFYQKPFIGAPVMAVFAESLENINSPAGKICNLPALYSKETSFFLCGSLHGGTGASGVPIMGRFLGRRKQPNWKWHIGACLLAPYCVPPDPPFPAAEEGEIIDDQRVAGLAQRFADHPAFENLLDEEREIIVKQILLGFYASPADMEARARQGLAYYRDRSPEFEQLYLVGKPEPDRLESWSNGGAKQNNPTNSAEVVAALAALRFFATTSSPADTDATPQGNYLIGASTPELGSEMRLSQLPRYRIPGSPQAQEIEPEGVFLSVAALSHLLTEELPWDKPGRGWDKTAKLGKLYEADEQRKADDKSAFDQTKDIMKSFVESMLGDSSVGWSGDDIRILKEFFSGSAAVSRKVERKFLRKEAKGILELGRSRLQVSTLEFAEWAPEGDQFSRGEYLRFAWQQLFSRTKPAARAAT